MNKIKGFTLAEMLVVMIIISILSMLSIPVLIKNTRDKEVFDLLKATYKKIETALIIDKIFSFNVEDLGYISVDNDIRIDDFAKFLKEKLNVINYCSPNEQCGFISDSLNGYTLRLINGSSLLINDDNNAFRDNVDENNHIIGSLYMDIDGPKGVNRAGHDQFGFYVTNKGLIPMGGPKDEIMPFTNCLRNPDFSCTAWILVNGNEDYKKCPSVVNWETNPTCK